MTIETKASQSARFETAFNRIHKKLKDTVKDAHTDKFTDLIHKGMSHALIRYYEPDLCQFAKLRNAIVHERIEEDYYIAEPHLDIIEKIEKIADELEQPQTALSIATKPVHYFREDDKLADVLSTIKKEGHSRFPVYSMNDEYAWLLTSAEIVQWLADHFSEATVTLNKVQLKQLYQDKITHEVAFASQYNSVLDIENLFEEYQDKSKKLEAVLITKNGKPSEQPNGIITSLDLLEAEIKE
jgi:predicted transcriptional regulator